VLLAVLHGSVLCNKRCCAGKPLQHVRLLCGSAADVLQHVRLLCGSAADVLLHGCREELCRLC
jgi:hypothetical protein